MVWGRIVGHGTGRRTPSRPASHELMQPQSATRTAFDVGRTAGECCCPKLERRFAHSKRAPDASMWLIANRERRPARRAHASVRLPGYVDERCVE